MIRDIFINYLLQVFFSLGLIVAAGLIIGLIQKGVYKLLGGSSRKIGILTGFIGTPIHELGHAIFCLIFGHKIVDMKLFSPDPSNGTLGYVSHTYNKKNIYHQIGNFFIGIGPIISCGLIITLFMYLFIPYVFQGVWREISGLNLSSFPSAINTVFQTFYLILINPYNLGNFLWWVFIFLSSSIALHMAISIPDIKCGLKGLGFTLAAMLIINIIVGVISLSALDWITDLVLSLSSYLIALLGICLLMSIIILCIAGIFRVFKKFLNKYKKCR